MQLNPVIRSLILLSLTAAFSFSQALTFRLDGKEVVGNTLEIKSRYEDTFVALGQLYGLGYRELLAANPEVSPWVPGEGTSVLLPLSFVLPSEVLTDKENIVLNLAELRLYHFLPDQKIVRTYAVGIGKEGWQTPTVKTEVTSVIRNPSWTPPESIRQEQAAKGNELPAVVPPGPNNPLGEYAVTLALPGYLFHGSNKKLGIGMRISHGCVRLYDSDIEELATSVTSGIKVTIVNEPVKVGWIQDRLYLEVHPQLEEVETRTTQVEEIVMEALARRPTHSVEIDWPKVREITERKSGIPEIISAPAPHG